MEAEDQSQMPDIQGIMEVDVGEVFPYREQKVDVDQLNIQLSNE